jgi:hypothetical protein
VAVREIVAVDSSDILLPLSVAWSANLVAAACDDRGGNGSRASRAVRQLP